MTICWVGLSHRVRATKRASTRSCGAITRLIVRRASNFLGGAFAVRHRPLVRAVGLEPTRRCHRGILSPLRLPVPPRPLWSSDQILSAFHGEVELASPESAPPCIVER